MRGALWALVLSACGGGALQLDPKPQTQDSAAASTTAATDTAGWAVTEPPECADPLEACGADCVDTETDPAHCGDCGVRCVVPNASPACARGRCGIESCDPGFGNCDRDLSNGCEQAVDCDPATTCTTSCDSVGSLDCSNPCSPTCAPPVEVCNLQDDDCDGVCDNGPLDGCRVAIHRTNGSLGHMYGPDEAEMAALGQATETADYFYLMAAETAGSTPLYRCDKGGGRTFLTTAETCELGVTPQLVVGYVASSAVCGATPLFRLYSGAESNHFYTVSPTERDTATTELGYRYESIVGYVFLEE